jgi:hypothetical protein
VDLEPHDNVEPVIERKCAECGATLTQVEIAESLETGGDYLCSVHAAERAPIADEDQLESS